MIHHFKLVCLALLTTMKYLCFTREARAFHTEAHPVNFKDLDADGGWESSPALCKLPSLQEPVQCRGRGYVAPFCPLTNTITRKSPVEVW